MQVYFSWQPLHSYQLEITNTKKRLLFITLLSVCVFVLFFSSYNCFLKEKLQPDLTDKAKTIVLKLFSILGYTDTLNKNCQLFS